VEKVKSRTQLEILKSTGSKNNKESIETDKMGMLSKSRRIEHIATDDKYKMEGNNKDGKAMIDENPEIPKEGLRTTAALGIKNMDKPHGQEMFGNKQMNRVKKTFELIKKKNESTSFFFSSVGYQIKSL
jgi:hypothetical protein